MNYEWVQPTLERLSDLLKMPACHNSYGTSRPAPSHVIKAISVMSKFAHLPVPKIMPTPSGGLDFTWQGTKTECFLVVCPNGMKVCALVDGKSRDFGDFRSVEDCLEEMLFDISRELTPSEENASP